ncbi:uncharacterized protein LOC112093201 [Morus notabilis]|uniref:uncharacterized protein LOC112093201 n=1 Tax=Morus notabilis TaxID=981085 RepID=UPI000CED5F0A|nr:uncharacterized protein LOC112093201 [Morus notabilis]
MYSLREGGSVSKPPLLDESNYSYWKARMRAFIKAIDERAWRLILTEWTHPTTTDNSGNVTLKLEETWLTDEDRLANYNSKALNVVFNVVDVNQFKLISTCESTKEAWEILQIAHEGTTAVKVSKLQILTTRFKELKMHEDDCIANFNSKLCDIANESFALGEKYSDTKLVRKTLRSLPEKFAYKVAAIEEAVDSMKLDELMGSLRTFELKFKKDKKENGMTFRSGVESQSNQEESEDEGELEESLARLTKNFKKILKKMKKKGNFKISLGLGSRDLILRVQNKLTQIRREEEFNAESVMDMVIYKQSVQTP